MELETPGVPVDAGPNVLDGTDPAALVMPAVVCPGAEVAADGAELEPTTPVDAVDGLTAEDDTGAMVPDAGDEATLVWPGVVAPGVETPAGDVELETPIAVVAGANVVDGLATGDDVGPMVLDDKGLATLVAPDVWAIEAVADVGAIEVGAELTKLEVDDTIGAVEVTAGLDETEAVCAIVEACWDEELAGAVDSAAVVTTDEEAGEDAVDPVVTAEVG